VGRQDVGNERHKQGQEEEKKQRGSVSPFKPSSSPSSLTLALPFGSSPPPISPSHPCSTCGCQNTPPTVKRYALLRGKGRPDGTHPSGSKRRFYPGAPAPSQVSGKLNRASLKEKCGQALARSSGVEGGRWKGNRKSKKQKEALTGNRATGLWVASAKGQQPHGHDSPALVICPAAIRCIGGLRPPYE
jgi:hypothetical protein